MTMERLSALDTEFLHLEDGIAHMHVAGVSVFKGPAPTVDEVGRLLTSKLHLIPRYRQRVRFAPFGLGRPVWEDDPHYNLAYHLRHTALPPPGDDADLCRLMGRLMSQPLDRNRPLWEAWMFEGLPKGRWGVISKIHHCMVDGISGVELLSVLLAVDRDEPLPEPQPWNAGQNPSGPAIVIDAWRGLAADLAAAAGRAPAALRDPRGTARSVTRTGRGAFRAGRHLGTTPLLSIEGTIGPHRVWAHSSARISDVRTIRRAFGGTLNDVVLAAVAGGYRTLLLRRGDDADHAVLRSLVPVSVRLEDEKGSPGNRVSAFLYELPIHIDDAIERLGVVREEMRDLKGSHMADAGEAAATLGNLAPPMIVGLVTRLGSRLMHRLPQRSVNTVTTNVPGPQFPLYCLGREMLEYYPYVPLSHGVRVGTAVLSYNGRLAFGITGDFDTAPDVGVLADAIVAGIKELKKLARIQSSSTTAGAAQPASTPAR